jgi:hypothetical protein
MHPGIIASGAIEGGSGVHHLFQGLGKIQSSQTSVWQVELQPDPSSRQVVV